MPPTDPGPHGGRPGDRSDGDRPSAPRRRGRGIVAATVLAGLAIVLAVLLLVPRCSQAGQDNGSPAAGTAVREEGADLRR